jgi:type I restriction enzyme S subunit
VSGWKTVTLEDVTEAGSDGLRRGPFGGAIKKDSFVPAGFKVYEQRHAIYADFDSGEYFISENHYRKLKAFAVQAGDMIVSCSGTLGRVAIVPPSVHPGVINQALLRIRPRLEAVFPPFFKMLLETPTIHSQLFGSAGGSAIKNVRPLAEIRKMRFPLPPLAEQKRIAEILDCAESLRRQRRAALTLLDELTQAIFLEMFGDPVSNPKKLPTKPLEQLCRRITDGTHQSPKWAETGHPFLFVTNITSGEIDFGTKKFISDETHLELTSRCPVELGDVLYSTVGSYGVPAVVRDGRKFAFQRHIAHIKPNSKVLDPTFLCAMLASYPLKRQADQVARGVAQKTVNLADIKKFTVFDITMDLQTQFTKLVGIANDLRVKTHASVKELDALFASLQNRAFRGEL